MDVSESSLHSSTSSADVTRLATEMTEELLKIQHPDLRMLARNAVDSWRAHQLQQIAFGSSCDDSSKSHKQILLEHPNGTFVDIDDEITDLISKIWNVGIDTAMSCQNHGVHHCVWIKFPSNDYHKFIEIVSSDHSSQQLYHSITNIWKSKNVLYRTDFKGNTGVFQFVDVFIPHVDCPEICHLLDTYVITNR